jgi:histidyl-tRNA synthetase
LTGAVNDLQSVDGYVVIADADQRRAALGIAQNLRSAGHRTITPLADAKVGKQFQAAEQAGAQFAVVVGSEYPALTVKSLATRDEISCDVSELSDTLAQILRK